ncbi:helix-turn-helix domain-containing protein [Paenacidovorax monticola]|uniref:helix-turn-helix domain-containing protein n=1 Tax=Paenacidovorax monticola TaxID=1926868 RepID=UPI001FE3801B|nr:helix-turn-helix domain-containing protein [Paenacidovorax monticola]
MRRAFAPRLGRAPCAGLRGVLRAEPAAVFRSRLTGQGSGHRALHHRRALARWAAPRARPRYGFTAPGPGARPAAPAPCRSASPVHAGPGRRHGATHAGARLSCSHGAHPHAYQLDLRINAARGLLGAGGAPADVAQALGFYDQSHFQHAFKQRVAATPGVYRRTAAPC